jgi:uncharacterized protein
MQAVTVMLRVARSEAGLTQAEVARRAGTSQPAVNRYEQGQAVPTLPTLERLLRACGRELSLRSVPRRGAAGVTSVRGQLGPQAAKLRRRRAALLVAARRRGARNVRVFGSVARGQDTAASDVDLLVDLEPGRTLVDLAGFRREAAEILGVGVDVSTLDMLKERARDRALEEALPL